MPYRKRAGKHVHAQDVEDGTQEVAAEAPLEIARAHGRNPATGPQKSGPHNTRSSNIANEAATTHKTAAEHAGRVADTRPASKSLSPPHQPAAAAAPARSPALTRPQHGQNIRATPPRAQNIANSAQNAAPSAHPSPATRHDTGAATRHDTGAATHASGHPAHMSPNLQGARAGTSSTATRVSTPVQPARRIAEVVTPARAPTPISTMSSAQRSETLATVLTALTQVLSLLAHPAADPASETAARTAEPVRASAEERRDVKMASQNVVAQADSAQRPVLLGALAAHQPSAALLDENNVEDEGEFYPEGAENDECDELEEDDGEYEEESDEEEEDGHQGKSVAVAHMLHDRHRKATTGPTSHPLTLYNCSQVQLARPQLELTASAPSSRMDRPTCMQGSYRLRGGQPRCRHLDLALPHNYMQHPRHLVPALHRPQTTHSPQLEDTRATVTTLPSLLLNTPRSLPPSHLQRSTSPKTRPNPRHSRLHVPRAAQHRARTTSALALRPAPRMQWPARTSN
ncbi:MAG: Uncharacterized protein FD187_3191, partial [bacterium]